MVLFGFLIFSRIAEFGSSKFDGTPVDSEYFNCRIQLLILGVLGIFTGSLGELLQDGEFDIFEKFAKIFHLFLTFAGFLISISFGLLNLNYLVLNLAEGNYCDPLVAVGSTMCSIFACTFFGHILALPFFDETFPQTENDKPKDMIIV